MSKRCSICEDIKELSEYYSQEKESKSKGRYTYYPPYCKECTKSKSHKWQLDNPEKRTKALNKYNVSEKGKRHFYEYGKSYRESGRYKEWQNNNKERLKEYRERRENEKTHEISTDEWARCLMYFEHSCSYCGLSEAEHKSTHYQQLHKEHVIHDGRNDIKNCVPNCKSCNSSKHTAPLHKWYNSKNPVYSQDRYLKIYNWIRYDYKTQ